MEITGGGKYKVLKSIKKSNKKKITKKFKKKIKKSKKIKMLIRNKSAKRRIPFSQTHNFDNLRFFDNSHFNSDLDLSYLERLFNSSSLGRDLVVKAAIWGHGGQTTVSNLHPIFSPLPSVQLNIFGYAVSGKCNIGNNEYLSLVDNEMRTTSNWPPNKSWFEHAYSQIYPTFVDPANLVVEPKYAAFEYVSNYGDLNQAPRGDKTYSGIKNDKDCFKSLGVTKNGPLLRIYEIIVNGINILQDKPPVDIHLQNFTSLSNIMIEIRNIFTHNQSIFDIIFKRYNLKSENFTKLVVNLLDLSCNYTLEEPTIGAVTVSKK